MGTSLDNSSFLASICSKVFHILAKSGSCVRSCMSRFKIRNWINFSLLELTSSNLSKKCHFPLKKPLKNTNFVPFCSGAGRVNGSGVAMIPERNRLFLGCLIQWLGCAYKAYAWLLSKIEASVSKENITKIHSLPRMVTDCGDRKQQVLL